MRELNPDLILIVEDSSTLRQAYAVALRRRGYRVLVAAGVEDGLAIARREKPLFIFCDYNLGKLSGMDLCRQVRGEAGLAAAIFVIITAGPVTPQQSGEEFHDLPDSWITKNFGTDHLLAEMEKWIRMMRVSG